MEAARHGRWSHGSTSAILRKPRSDSSRNRNPMCVASNNYRRAAQRDPLSCVATGTIARAGCLLAQQRNRSCSAISSDGADGTDRDGAMLALLPLSSLSSAPMVDITSVSGASLKAAAEFFADAFWLDGTTTGAVNLQGRERASLVKCVADDFQSRYGDSWALDQGPRPSSTRNRLFRSRLLLAREVEGAIVGCVGVEAALFDAASGTVLPSASAEVTLRRELDAISWDEKELSRTADVYREGGLAALAEILTPEYTPVGLMANLAISPSVRRTGLGAELCECCELGCTEWGLPGMILQVEDANEAARRLYDSLGYVDVCADEEACALRVCPGEQSLASAFFNVDPADLLQEAPATVVTMAKQIATSSGE